MQNALLSSNRSACQKPLIRPPLYPKASDRQKAFTALNIDKSQEISYQELLAGKTRLPAVASFFTRATAFQEIDLDANGTLSVKEIDAMFPPGIKAKTRSAYGIYTFATWFSAKTIPSTALWTQAVQTRRQRADFALRLDVNSDGYITQSEFAKMYSSRTKRNAANHLRIFRSELRILHFCPVLQASCRTEFKG